MVLTSAQQVRLGIQDAPTLANDVYYGDGMATGFMLPHRNITTASAFVSANGGWSATGATFNASGVVAFDTPISANSAFLVTYTYSVFSDDEIDHFLDAGGNSINGARLEAVKTLMFDAIKRARWGAPDGTTFDDTQAQGHLRDMYNKFSNELTQDAIGGGATYSWGANQS
jgi:hypothetical protein